MLNIIAHLSIQLDANGNISIQNSGDVAALYRQLAQALTQDSSGLGLPKEVLSAATAGDE